MQEFFKRFPGVVSVKSDVKIPDNVNVIGRQDDHVAVTGNGVIELRRRHESTVIPPLCPETRRGFVAETNLPTIYGTFRMRAYRDPKGAEFVAMIAGFPENCSEVLLRVHDQCATSEVFGSLKCDCKAQLDFALNEIQQHNGIVVYLPQEGRGIGLANKVAAYAAQEFGLDTVDANRLLGLPDDLREYDMVKFILDDLEVESVRLITNNPRKISRLTDIDIDVVGRVECHVEVDSDHCRKYVEAKVTRMGHFARRVAT